LERKKEADGYTLHVTTDEMKTTAKALGIIGAGLVVIRIVRFLVWK